MIQHNATEAIPETRMHCSLFYLVSAHGLKAEIKARCWFHNVQEHLPSCVVEYTQPDNAVLAEDGLNLFSTGSDANGQTRVAEF